MSFYDISSPKKTQPKFIYNHVYLNLFRENTRTSRGRQLSKSKERRFNPSRLKKGRLIRHLEALSGLFTMLYRKHNFDERKICHVILSILQNRQLHLRNV